MKASGIESHWQRNAVHSKANTPYEVKKQATDKMILLFLSSSFSLSSSLMSEGRLSHCTSLVIYLLPRDNRAWGCPKEEKVNISRRWRFEVLQFKLVFNSTLTKDFLQELMLD